MTNKKLEKILIVEDNPVHIEDARKIFGEFPDLKVEFATTLNEAL